MSSFTQYLWGIYLVAAVGIIAMLWYGLRRLNSLVVQDIAIVLAIALLLTPCSALPGGSALSPALVVVVIEGLFDDQLSVWRGGWPIVLAAAVLLMLLVGKYWIEARYFGKTNPCSRFAKAPGETAAPDAVATEKTESSLPRSEDEPGSGLSTPAAVSSVKGPAADPG